MIIELFQLYIISAATVRRISRKNEIIHETVQDITEPILLDSESDDHIELDLSDKIEVEVAKVWTRKYHNARYSRCRLDLEIRGSSLLEYQLSKGADILLV